MAAGVSASEVDAQMGDAAFGTLRLLGFDTARMEAKYRLPFKR